MTPQTQSLRERTEGSEEAKELNWTNQTDKDKKEQMRNNLWLNRRQRLCLIWSWLPLLLMASTYYSHLTGAMKDWFFHLSWGRTMLHCASSSESVCLRKRERNQAESNGRGATADTGGTAVSLQRLHCSPPPRSPLPQRGPHTPFLILLSHSAAWPGALLCHTQITKWAWVTQTLLGWTCVLSVDKYRQDACATKHSSID